MPKTTSGWWAIGLIVVMFVLLFVGMSFADTLYESVSAGDTLLEDFRARPALTLSMLSGFGAGIAAFITGLISIIRQKERNLLVYLSTLVGAGLIIFLLAEIMFPH